MPTPTTGTIQTGQNLSTLVKSLNTTPDAFIKANPWAAAQPGEKNSFLGLTGNVKVGQTYNIPDTTSTPNQITPIPGSGTYAEDLTKSFDTGNNQNPNQATGTSDALRQQQANQQIADIKSQMERGLTKPTPINSVDQYNQLRDQQGIVQDENELNAIKTEQQNIQNDLNNYKQGSGAMMTEAGRLGDVSEKERNANYRLSQLAIQEQSVTSRINSKNSYISTAMNLAQQDYKTASDAYNQAFNENLQAVQQYNSQVSKDKQDAMTAWTTISNLAKDNNMDFSQLDPAMKANISTLELKAGLPQGTFQAISNAAPNQKILSPVESTNADGSKSIYFFAQDPKTGQPTLLKTFGVGGGGGGGSTLGSGAPGTINAPPSDVGGSTNESQSILSQTGLSIPAFNFLTQGVSALTRMTASQRQQYMNEAQNWANKNGIDVSTFQSQYKSYNDVLSKNIERANQTKIFAGEISGTVDQFITDVGGDLGSLKAANVARLLAGQQVNDPMVQKYAFNLQTMQNDLAGYYAASRGSTQPDDSDKQAAASVITNGINGKSAQAFKNSIIANETKVTSVVNDAVNGARSQVWNLFGVGNKYQATGSSLKPEDVDYTLKSSAGKDGFVSPDDWLKMKQMYINQGGTATQFEKDYGKYKNPKNPYYQ